MNRLCFDQIKGILFDFEGTLVGSQWNRKGAVEETLKKLSEMGFPIDRLQDLKYSLLMAEAVRIAPEIGQAPVEVKKVVEAIFDRYDEDALSRWTLRPGAKEFLHAVKEAGMRTGLVSNAGKAALKKALERFDLTNLLEVIVSRNDVRMLKPSGEGIDLALNQLGVTKGSGLYIGDSLDDILASKEAGLRVVLLLGGEAHREVFLSVNPDYFVKDFNELFTLFRRGCS